MTAVTEQIQVLNVRNYFCDKEHWNCCKIVILNVHNTMKICNQPSYKCQDILCYLQISKLTNQLRLHSAQQQFQRGPTRITTDLSTLISLLHMSSIFYRAYELRANKILSSALFSFMELFSLSWCWTGIMQQ